MSTLRDGDTEQRIIIVSAGRNCSHYISEWFNSILFQRYKNYLCIAIDDLSADETNKKLSRCVSLDSRFRLIKNYQRCWALYNKSVILQELNLVEDEDIIVSVDLDDYLTTDTALATINEIFSDDNVWFSYGNMEPYSKVCVPIDWNVPVRKQSWKASHLRACRWFLMKNILKKDLQDKKGNRLKYPEDRILCYPMLEMAGKEHVYCNRSILYHYRHDNPQCDHRINQKEIDIVLRDILSRPPYIKKTKQELITHKNDWL